MNLEKNNIDEIVVIDVRTPGEFERGHIEGSLNIPLNEIENRMNEIKSYNKPLVLCCASGMRSMQACQLLMHYGLKDVQNGGSWSILQYQLNDIKQIK